MAIDCLEKWLWNKLRSDSTLLGYTGGSASDTRVYHAHFPVERRATIGTTEAIITYSPSGISPLYGDDIVDAIQVPDETYSIDIFSRSKNTIRNCADRIHVLLENDKLMFRVSDDGTNYFSIKKVRLIAKEDFWEEDDHIFHRHLKYSFEKILKVT